jgi:hypothetical protein
MPRYSAGALSTAGSTTLPIGSLYSSASVGAKIREIGITNATDLSVALKLVRLTTAGTQGTGLTEAKHDPDSPAASCTAFNTHSVGPTLGDDLGYRVHISAAKGAGQIWTFGDQGLRISVGTANGIGIIVENGTGQACQFYFVWDE